MKLKHIDTVATIGLVGAFGSQFYNPWRTAERQANEERSQMLGELNQLQRQHSNAVLNGDFDSANALHERIHEIQSTIPAYDNINLGDELPLLIGGLCFLYLYARGRSVGQ